MVIFLFVGKKLIYYAEKKVGMKYRTCKPVFYMA